MEKLRAGTNTEIGATSCRNEVRFFLEKEAIDPFFDDYNQEMFVAHAIIDKVRYFNGKPVMLIINKEILVRILKSHIENIKKTLGAEHADRT